MSEIEQLKKIWRDRKSSGGFRRSTKLIVPKISFDDGLGDLNNDHWEFVVPYAFREALDIKMETRKKDKKPYKVWTQGPIIAFKDSDTLVSKMGDIAVQVQFANPMGWDPVKKDMDLGSVVFDVYDILDGKYIKDLRLSCTQMLFLDMLMHRPTLSSEKFQQL